MLRCHPLFIPTSCYGNREIFLNIVTFANEYVITDAELVSRIMWFQHHTLAQRLAHLGGPNQIGTEGRYHPSSGRVELIVTDQMLYGGSVTITYAQPLRTFCISGGAVSDYFII
uniref:AraC family transcriptional regulator n=1 Tax=Caenorhabditis tropicalis TaxID=1561998 RepID=A0A1I7US53_9PELO